jgi:hypothetical protein
VSQRVIAYYEREGAQPPGAMLNELARALRVRIEELPGTKPIPDQTHPKTARLLKRLRRVQETPASRSARRPQDRRRPPRCPPADRPALAADVLARAASGDSVQLILASVGR